MLCDSDWITNMTKTVAEGTVVGLTGITGNVELNTRSDVCFGGWGRWGYEGERVRK